MITTIDSQPEESLLDDPNCLHTLCFCCFRDAISVRQWIHTLVPRNKNGNYLKWSSGGRSSRGLRRRMKFIRNVERHYEKIDFAVHCVSATEAQIGDFANAFYLENIKNIQQEFDVKGRNCLVFKITEQKSIRMPVLRAAKIIWIYYCIKYMKEEQNLHGYIFSDWFAGDARIGEDPALGVAMVNFLLSKTSIDLSLSIANEPGARDDDLLSDWFAGWSNSSKGDTPHSELSTRFDALINRKPKKVDWVMTQAVITVDINSS